MKKLIVLALIAAMIAIVSVNFAKAVEPNVPEPNTPEPNAPKLSMSFTLAAEPNTPGPNTPAEPNTPKS
jgi:hypothetical protein